MNAEIMGKRLGLLHELLPGGSRFALLSLQGRNLRSLELLIEGVQSAAAVVGVQIEVLTAGTDRDIDTAFESLVQKRADGLLVGPFILFASRQVQIVNLAARHGVPAIYFDRSFAEAGGLMSYGQLSYDDMARQGGIYVGRILNGEKPADLPVMRPTRFELVINLRTAKKIGVNVPRTLLVTADEVIE